jgi:glycosyltransferase involved in cell wall biosynthesis
MRVIIVRREQGIALSMDVYADNLVAELRTIRPDWDIIEIAPEPWSKQGNQWQSGTGLRKYYERLWRHPQAVQQLEGDIFHIIDHSNAHVAYWLKHKSCKVIVTCHDLVQFIYPEILKGQSRFPAVSMASWKYSVGGIAGVDRTIAVSTNTANDVAQLLHIPPAQIAVVPNGVESYFHRLPAAKIAAIRQRYESSPTSFCLLNVGSNHHRKNIPTVLRALVMLRDQGMDVKLWKVGEKFTPELSAFVRSHQLESIITFIDRPDKTALLEIYNAADVLLAPSLYEGFGLTILEAMACETPVITSNVSSLPEVAGNAAILVDPLDVEAIVAAVCRLRQDASYYQATIELGVEQASRFTWLKAAEQTAAIYEDALPKT